MADADDSVSMVGAAMRRRQAIDQFLWGRAALQFAGISIAEHEVFAQSLGAGAAAEVLLLIIARQCGTDQCRWQRARDVGIPWQGKRWSSLSALQGCYNNAVATAAEMDTRLSSSAAASRPQPPPPPPEKPWPEQHFDKKTFNKHGLEFKAPNQRAKCKFTKRLKYDIQLKKPNAFDLEWVYSVPCGRILKAGPCQSWIFLIVPEDTRRDGAKKKEWAAEYLATLDWEWVTNRKYKRFVCPQCAEDGE